MTLVEFIAIFKVVAWGLTPNWPPTEIDKRATEFYEVSQETNTDPILLVAISIYECDLKDNKDATYSNINGIYARDLCPMGLHYKTHSKKTGANIARREIILRAARTLEFYHRYHNDNHHKRHSYIQHYNSGYKIINYGDPAKYSSSVLYLKDVITYDFNKDLKDLDDTNITFRARQLGKRIREWMKESYEESAHCQCDSLPNHGWDYSCFCMGKN